MQFQRLRLTGFKSFVDPTELYIEEGLTGIVGPNGCGKSNLLEALRWVMGENRPSNVRGEGMDDVIFAGTAFRPQRNLAEVSLLLDNAERKGPAAFADADQIEISRRIERESGSAYRLNGRETRARDVQLLFADLATGAHSPSLVSQGRIGSLINAKPKDRRMLLEEAAGISGLHSRRHEAELRLNGAKTNLERLEDVMVQIEAQLANLKRQARQAARYKSLSGRLRAAEALMFHLRWIHATETREKAAALLTEIERDVGERTKSVASASSLQAEAAAKLPPLRETEAQASAAAHRLEVERENLDAEVQRLTETMTDLRSRLEQITGDMAREQSQADDAKSHLSRLTEEKSTLEQEAATHTERLEAARQTVEELAKKTVEAEDRLDALNEETAANLARRQGLTTQVEELGGRVQDLRRRLEAAEKERAERMAEAGENSAARDAEARIAAARDDVDRARDTLDEAVEAREAAAHAETEARAERDEAFQAVRDLKAEERAISTLLGQQDTDAFPPVLEEIHVSAGYETALAAAFGDDLQLPTDSSAPAFWEQLTAQSGDAALPAGVEPLAKFVEAPDALARALAQVGVVDADKGADLQNGLAPGQILVSLEGAAWRWDGKVVRTGAKSAAAIRLEQKNRLEAVEAELVGLQETADKAEAAHSRAADALDDAAAEEKSARDTVQEAEDALIEARNAQASLAREQAEQNSRIHALEETIERLSDDITGTERRLADAKDALAAQPPADATANQVAETRREVEAARDALSEAKAMRDSLNREADFRTKRLTAIGHDLDSWNARGHGAQRQLAQLSERRTQAETELNALEAKPAELEDKKSRLSALIAEAGEKRRAAQAALAEAESDLSEKDQALRAAEQALSEAREKRARAIADADHATERLENVRNRIREELECRPEDVFEISEHKPDTPLPDMDDVTKRLERLRRERDTMGPVNLRAEVEAEEIQVQLDEMLTEKEDLEAAINKLRHAIASLNREGRERLKEAFGEVNQHFTELFTRLFGGGTAYLELTESDDPLDAGLEIYASPPGKRLQNMSLLSGGEQALTALSLIFAVFLTNPAPICVLDEVDAPLDDANVERFCGLLHDITAQTGTRFLVVTHHAVTMSHLNRLFGVTMGEQGVSQLVSVDLGQAEQMIAAE